MPKFLTILEMKGGLGNQLFQFGAGLVRTKGQISPLYFNISYYNSDSRHGGFVLPHLFPQIKFQTTESRSFSVPTAVIRLDALADSDPGGIINTHYPIYLSGYFQNINFINPALGFLKGMFKETIFGKYREWAQSLNVLRARNNTKVIGVHFRRGDYVGNPNFGVPRLDDVLCAVAQELRVTAESATSRIVLFTDAPKSEVVPVAQKLDAFVFNASQEFGKIEKDIMEFIAMTQCDSLVCANSSFSYWAGLLSDTVSRFYIPCPWVRSNAVKTESLTSEPRIIVYRCDLQ